MLKMWLLIAICLLCITVVLTEDTTVAVKHGENATLTFHMKTNTNKIIELLKGNINRKKRILAWANMTVTSSISKSYSITAGVISVYINDVTKNDGAKYCADTECTLLIVTDFPVTSLRTESSFQQPVLHPVSRIGNKLLGGLNLTCDATSTTNSDDHNLPMVYTWFKDDVFYTTSTSNILHDTNITISSTGREITCTATDDPHCSEMLRSLTRGSSLATVRDDPKCKGVLGVSTSFTLQPEYPPYKIILEPPAKAIERNIGDTLRLKCNSDCNPQCNVSWSKDGKVIQEKSVLYIEQVQSSDEGDYTCKVYNKYGDIQNTLTLRITEGITAGSTTTTSGAIESIETYSSKTTYTDALNLYLSIGIGILVVILAIITIAFILRHVQKGCFKPKKKKRKRRRAVYRKVLRDGDTIEMNSASTINQLRVKFSVPQQDEDVELVYADLDLKPCRNNVIHGHKQDTVVYAEFDFTKIPPPLPCGYLDSDYESDSD